MDRLLTMTVFRRVAELQSFSAAARDLGLSNAAVSKHVGVLEEHLRTRLLHRTTRKVSVTPAGVAYLERCARILDDVDELEHAVRQTSGAPRGLLRVNAPSGFGLLHLSPHVPAILAANPELTIDLSLNDRFVDLVEEGVDVVIRIASELADSSTLVAQRLAGTEQHIVATPRYLKQHGAPRRLADLARHACLVYGVRGAQWTFLQRGKPVSVDVTGPLRIDHTLALRDAVLADAGLAMMPAFYTEELVRAGRLRVVLGSLRAPRVWIHAVYPRQRHLSTKIRVFVDHVRAALRSAPWAIMP